MRTTDLRRINFDRRDTEAVRNLVFVLSSHARDILEQEERCLVGVWLFVPLEDLHELVEQSALTAFQTLSSFLFENTRELHVLE